MHIPAALHEPLTAVLHEAGDSTPIQAGRALGGGCINNALRLDTGQGRYLLKWNANALPDMFLVEARGLELMQATATVRVPAVLGARNDTPTHPAFLVLEWLEGPTSHRQPAAQATLGEQLALLHQAAAPARYGLDHDNYLGTTPQYNGWYDDWIDFFRERRLRPQLELAAHTGQLPGQRRRALERLMERLEEWLGGVERRPALLHGDLWGGNVIPGPGGAPALIDPAVYYGDREAELAYTELFGGFGSDFYEAYAATWPLSAGYAERRDLYNLYHLLNHMNLFGSSYATSVDEVTRHYVGAG